MSREEREQAMAPRREEARDCQRCGLARSRTQVVWGEGNPDTELLFLGEGPGQREDETGRPFVGRAGKLLDDILKAVELDRERVYIANVVKCRPPGNRNPTDAEAAACKPWLDVQLEVIRPRLIVALGNVAKAHLLGARAPGITRCRGQWYRWREGAALMPMFHPSYLLRNDARHRGSPKWLTWQDIQEVRRRLDLLSEGPAGVEEALRPTAELPA